MGDNIVSIYNLRYKENLCKTVLDSFDIFDALSELKRIEGCLIRPKEIHGIYDEAKKDFLELNGTLKGFSMAQ